jgi:endoglycosylceramidase
VGLQDRYGAAWAYVAQRFRDDANVLGYELLNEPWPGSTWQSCAQPVGCPDFDAKLTAFSQRMVRAIRRVDSRTPVIYEPNVLFNDGADTQMGAIGDPHALFAFHDYCLSAGGSGSNEGCDTFDNLVFANAEKHIQATGDASLMTEFGATDAADILDAMVTRADRNMVGWQEWHYCGCSDPTTSGPGATQAIVIDPAKPPTGANVKAAKLALLTRPYPLAVAGTPESYGFDAASHTFKLRFSTRRADRQGAFAPGAISEIELPARQYPSGYRLSVQGARVLSAPGADILTIASCPGAGEVAVSVAPAGPAAATCRPPARATRRAAALRVTVRPHRVRAGRRVTLRIRVWAGRRPAAGVRLTLAGHHARTGRRGRATMRLRARRAGRLVLRARGSHASGRAVIRVLPRRRGRR